MILCGIDPGLNGAIALRDLKTGKLTIHDMPVLQLKKKSLDYHGLAAILSNAHRCCGGVGHAWIEQTWNRPGDYPSQPRKTDPTRDRRRGNSGILVGIYMTCLGVLSTLGIPWTVVPPQTWKKFLTVPADKEGARSRANQLMPEFANQWPLKKHDGRAEAALIVQYGMQTLNGIAAGVT